MAVEDDTEILVGRDCAYGLVSDGSVGAGTCEGEVWRNSVTM